VGLAQRRADAGDGAARAVGLDPRLAHARQRRQLGVQAACDEHLREHGGQGVERVVGERAPLDLDAQLVAAEPTARAAGQQHPHRDVIRTRTDRARVKPRPPHRLDPSFAHRSGRVNTQP
jgi:hypothetical protein